VSIEFLGLFDCVYGGQRIAHYLDKQLKLFGKPVPNTVKHALHILAIDEQRPLFRPLLFGNGSKHNDFEQIWMPGVHGDIGGCYADDFLGQMSFLTMVEKTDSNTALQFDTIKSDDITMTLDDIKVSARPAFPGRVAVGQEWTVPWRIASVGVKHYRRPPANVPQLLHFVADALKGRDITIRDGRKKREYALSDDFNRLDRMNRDRSYDWCRPCR
jgi:hypothetical protein